MQKNKLIKLLQQYKADEISEDELFNYIENLPYEDISFARIDHHRTIRCGFPEVIFCQYKTPEQISIISEKLVKQGSNLLATKASKEIERRYLLERNLLVEKTVKKKEKKPMQS